MDAVGAGRELDFRVVLFVFGGLSTATGGEAEPVVAEGLVAVTGVMVSRGSGDSRSPCRYKAAALAEGVS